MTFNLRTRYVAPAGRHHLIESLSIPNEPLIHAMLNKTANESENAASAPRTGRRKRRRVGPRFGLTRLPAAEFPETKSTSFVILNISFVRHGRWTMLSGCPGLSPPRSLNLAPKRTQQQPDTSTRTECRNWLADQC